MAVLMGLILWLTMAACGGKNVTGVSDQLPRELTVLEKKLVERDNRFSIDLFKQTNALDAKKNVILSPLSASFALAMTLNGANHATRIR
ncbi:MAG: serpin family protein [candidate division KSB1 bacterium]|nr:serpin family protein [candidate division KSB1 bacterium]